MGLKKSFLIGLVLLESVLLSYINSCFAGDPVDQCKVTSHPIPSKSFVEDWKEILIKARAFKTESPTISEIDLSRRWWYLPFQSTNLEPLIRDSLRKKFIDPDNTSHYGLVWLDLTNRTVRGWELKNALKYFPRIKGLSLANTEMHTDYLPYLTGLRDLEVLDLKNNPALSASSEPFYSYIDACLRGLRSLKYLNREGTGLTFLKRPQLLEALSIIEGRRQNKFINLPSELRSEIASYLQQDEMKLMTGLSTDSYFKKGLLWKGQTRLNLDGDEVSKRLSQAIQVIPSENIKELNLSGSDLRDSDLEMISSYFPSLMDLDVSKTGVTRSYLDNWIILNASKDSAPGYYSYRLGLMREKGLKSSRIPIDLVAASNAYLRAAKQGHPVAQLKIAQAYEGKSLLPPPEFGKQDIDDAHHWYEKALKAGNAASPLK